VPRNYKNSQQFIAAAIEERLLLVPGNPLFRGATLTLGSAMRRRITHWKRGLTDIAKASFDGFFKKNHNKFSF